MKIETRETYFAPVGECEFYDCGSPYETQIGIYMVKTECLWNAWFGADDYGHRLYMTGYSTDMSVEDVLFELMDDVDWYIREFISINEGRVIELYDRK